MDRRDEPAVSAPVDRRRRRVVTRGHAHTGAHRVGVGRYNRLAVRAAREQRSTAGAEESGFDEWLAGEQEKGLYAGYDADSDSAKLEERVAAGECFPLVLVE